MKEYNRVTNEIHAPEALIEKTKAAVRKEEQRVKDQPKKTLVFSKRLAAIAAVLVAAVIMVPVIRTGMNTSVGDGTGNSYQGETENPLRLGQETDTPEILSKDHTVITPGKWTEKPEDAAAGEVKERNGVRISLFAAEGKIAAEFTVDGKLYSAVNEDGDEEQLLKDIEEYLEQSMK